MQAIILAAGNDLQLGNKQTPRCLLKIGRKPLINHLADQLPKEITEVVLVVGQQKKKIKEQVGQSLNNRPVKYVTQKEQLGTGHALWTARSAITSERFMVLMSDNLYHRQDMAQCLKYKNTLLAKKMEMPERYGVVNTSDQRLISVSERARDCVSTLINCGLYVLTSEIFNYPLVDIGSQTDGHREYGLPQQITLLAETESVHIEWARFWIPISTIQEFKATNKYLKKIYQ